MKNGILAIIIGGVISGILVFLFQQGYLEFQKTPQIVTEEIYPAYQTVAGRDMTFTIKVHNEGQADAINCHVYFDDGLKDQNTYLPSTIFPLAIGEATNIPVTSGVYGQAVNYTISAYAQCSNSNPSTTIVRTLIVSAGYS